ncbi:YolD-like family protein [Heyndrickxia sporothermodurans]|uniref:YolD-like family protein n=1 Tax=Heyndrickxia sporothermodurans TaxID=46224 RepID=A0A150KM91_9BACI|nr:YolD-like family protein [Heyndrickxia sporothermodurans]KYC95153.1 hypothetical protein B4102_1424 [Heyndrickxia sporothermodurans]MBL5768710.1 YolD-like family protein [Heyndrickxia sporothermodurans]MBL5772428.1 YolD-like family protein [Heyndrickxia sporothermodurans]MBL5776305.1 YolD-like family protein [Heyndrickxia sporothermodurans]MBL5779482.1 YolD-like family protein [Heyndrickxia sporothermodurans]
MIRDRGRIKWNSLMLPEHVKMLRDWAEEDTYEQQKYMDEQQLERMDDIMNEAIECGKTVTITHYRNHHHELVLGLIKRYKPLEGKLDIIDRFDEVHTIFLENIVDVQMIEDEI